MRVRLKAIQNELVALAVDAFNQYGAESDMSTLIAKAANLIRDAKLMADNPKLKQVRCLIQNGVSHAAKDGFPLRTICGHEIDGAKRVMGDEVVPTCADCIKIMFP